MSLLEDQVRREARKRGLRLVKSRPRRGSEATSGRFMLVDARTKEIVAGDDAADMGSHWNKPPPLWKPTLSQLGCRRAGLMLDLDRRSVRSGGRHDVRSWSWPASDYQVVAARGALGKHWRIQEMNSQRSPF